MSDDRFEKLEQVLLTKVAEDAPVSTEDLSDRVRQADPSVDPAEVRYALWHLVSEGRLGFDPAWKVISGPPANGAVA